MGKYEELQQRIEALEYERFKDTHEHVWRYSKHITEWPKDSFNPGRVLFWSWECVIEKCQLGSSGTNHRGGLPDHFPDELR